MSAFQVCHCGGAPGVPHPSRCPYPYYGDVPSQVAKWQQAAELRAAQLKSAEAAANAASLAELCDMAERAAALVHQVRRYLVDAYVTGENVEPAAVILEHLRALRKEAGVAVQYCHAFEFENGAPNLSSK